MINILGINPKKLARKYAFYSTLNAGAFAINSNFDIWNCFQKNIKLAAKKGRIFGTDQVALALTIYEDKTPTQFLPAYCNWMCDFHLPVYDEINIREQCRCSDQKIKFAIENLSKMKGYAS